jgi:hypothetical protein
MGSALAAGSAAGNAIPGAGLTVGSVYYVSSSGLALAKADASTTVPAIGIAVSDTLVLTYGVYKFASSQGWTDGAILYVSDATAGAVITSAPSTSGHLVQRIGVALASDTILIAPSVDVGTVK